MIEVIVWIESEDPHRQVSECILEFTLRLQAKTFMEACFGLANAGVFVQSDDGGTIWYPPSSVRRVKQSGTAPMVKEKA